MVLYKKKKFTLVDLSILKKAFDLMEQKKKIYDYIERGGDNRKDKAMRGNLPYNGNYNKEMFDEVLEECMQARREAKRFNDLLNRYKANIDELKTKLPEVLLKDRMGIAVLKQEKCYLIVISFHSYYHSGNRGQDASQRLTYLLFDFLEKVKMSGIHYPVIIGGDFNCDILVPHPYAHNFGQFLVNYYVPRHVLRPLRSALECKDFIVVSKPSHDFPLKFKNPTITAHDMVLTTEFEATLERLSTQEKLKKERRITNHSPLSTILCNWSNAN